MSDQERAIDPVSTEAGEVQKIIEANKKNYVPGDYDHYKILQNLLSLSNDEVINTDYPKNKNEDSKESITSLSS